METDLKQRTKQFAIANNQRCIRPYLKTLRHMRSGSADSKIRHLSGRPVPGGPTSKIRRRFHQQDRRCTSGTG